MAWQLFIPKRLSVYVYIYIYRPRYVPVRKRDTRTANTAVSIDMSVYLINEYIYIYEDLLLFCGL